VIPRSGGGWYGTSKKLIEDDVRAVLFHPRGAVCNQPWVKGMTQMVNGIYNGSRFEDVWLDK
jgi:peptide/nickel transport system substrate-binding protein